MKSCLIIGNANVGKTMFLLNFAGYMGIKEVEVIHSFIDKPDYKKKYQINMAIDQLCSEKPHKTIGTQKINLNIKIGKGIKPIQIIDTTGLTDGIHPDHMVRKGMVITLTELSKADLVLHVLDSNYYRINDKSNSFELDMQIANYCKFQKGYIILANKIDLDPDKIGLSKIKTLFAGNIILPISSVDRKGFKEVKEFVEGNI